MRQIDILIELTVPDNTAFTVLRTLQELGYPELTRVERADHVLLEVEDAASPEAVARSVRHAEILFNPNKHRLSYATADAPVRQPRTWEALVRDKEEDNTRLVGLLRTTFGLTSLHALARAVGWRLADSGGPAGPQRLAWACQVLLANPVSQVWEIRPLRVATAVGERPTPMENMSR